MASIQKRKGKKRTTYQYTISHKSLDAPLRKGGFRTSGEAKAAAAEIEVQLNKGIIPFLRPAPFDEYFDSWVKLYKSNLKTATLNHYRYTHDRIKDYFASTPLQNISSQDYQMFLNQLGSGRSKETVEKVHGHIRACVLDAVDEQIIPRDFTRKGELIYSVVAKDEAEKHLNYNDSILLLNTLKKWLNRGLEYYLLLLGLVTGFRFEELVGLTFEDFDFINNKVNVDKTWGYNNKMELGFGPTKNKQSIRKIVVDKKTMDLFKDLFDTLHKNANHLVFYNSRSKYKVITNERANKFLREILLELKISPAITMHGLRHTHGV
ncbi:tyrosine-type recombinase/integrase [Robertmurraya andreesenii]|uniref:Integrase n=1 Tax=Anoxybacillus andreesenii TaxID=1325932 RepID=A0ABT9VAR6_9BACL|nr:tyrosine-type recombinase/integrase [Robertmurraya andreesenii]MDQ0158037.1 integrase [Robertmurraya andreesenii]